MYIYRFTSTSTLLLLLYFVTDYYYLCKLIIINEFYEKDIRKIKK